MKMGRVRYSVYFRVYQNENITCFELNLFSHFKQVAFFSVSFSSELFSVFFWPKLGSVKTVR